CVPNHWSGRSALAGRRVAKVPHVVLDLLERRPLHRLLPDAVPLEDGEGSVPGNRGGDPFMEGGRDSKRDVIPEFGNKRTRTPPDRAEDPTRPPPNALDELVGKIVCREKLDRTNPADIVRATVMAAAEAPELVPAYGSGRPDPSAERNRIAREQENLS